MGKWKGMMVLAADTAWPCEGHQPHLVPEQQGTDGGNWFLATQERRGLERQVVWMSIQGPQRRKVGREARQQELIDLLGLLQVFEAVRA